MTTWEELRRAEAEKPYWAELEKHLVEERSTYEVFPAAEEVFAALEATPFAEVKVVILGQDSVIESNHPSPPSTNRRSSAYESFSGSRPFSSANDFLTETGQTSIDLQIPNWAPEPLATRS